MVLGHELLEVGFLGTGGGGVDQDAYDTLYTALVLLCRTAAPFLPFQVKDFKAQQAAGHPTWLTIGPWAHASPAGRSNPNNTFPSGGALPGYDVGHVLGEGGFCKVRLGVHQLSRANVAVKIIDKLKLVDVNDKKRVGRELRVLKALRHGCVIRLYEVVETPSRIFVIMEHADGGSLLDYVRGQKRLAEAESCRIFQQVVSALEYCHASDVIHRDVKLENILLDSKGNAKLIDFGLAAIAPPNKRLRVHCGSPSYAAPEIVARKAYLGPPVDVWSLGVVLFACVSGYLPFHASNGNKQELCQRIMSGVYKAPDFISREVESLIRHMLTVEPERRITFPEAKGHRWVLAHSRASIPRTHGFARPSVLLHADRSPEVVLGSVDMNVLNRLEKDGGFDKRSVLDSLRHDTHDHAAASYYLLGQQMLASGEMTKAQEADLARTLSFPHDSASSCAGAPSAEEDASFGVEMAESSTAPVTPAWG